MMEESGDELPCKLRYAVSVGDVGKHVVARGVCEAHIQVQAAPDGIGERTRHEGCIDAALAGNPVD